MIVNSEQCVVGATILCDGMYTTHTTNQQTHKPEKHEGVCCVTCVLAWLRAHYTTPAIPQKKDEERKRSKAKQKKKENRKKE